MLHDNTCPLLFVIILLKNSAHSIDLQSKLFYCFLHNSNTELKIVKLDSAKNTMTHMLFVCYEPC